MARYGKCIPLKKPYCGCLRNPPVHNCNPVISPWNTIAGSTLARATAARRRAAKSPQEETKRSISGTAWSWPSGKPSMLNYQQFYVGKLHVFSWWSHSYPIYKRIFHFGYQVWKYHWEYHGNDGFNTIMVSMGLMGMEHSYHGIVTYDHGHGLIYKWIIIIIMEISWD